MVLIAMSVLLLQGAGTRGLVPGAETDLRPNVVVILTDDMRTDEMHFLPFTQELLAGGGTTYANAISPHPICCPARAELVTGQYGHNNGVRHNLGPYGGIGSLQNPNDTIGRWLDLAGYRTGYHGKYLNGYRRSLGRPAGWDVWDPIVGGTTYAYWRSEWYDGDVYEDRYITDVTSERVDGMVEELSGDDPFLMVVNHTAPHGRTGGLVKKPATQPKYDDEYLDLRPGFMEKPSFYEEDVSDLPRDLFEADFTKKDELIRARARARALRSVDDSIRRLVTDLEEAGELDNTILVFTSDNGFVLGEHRMHGKNYLVDESLDIPLLVRGPGIPAGATNTETVTLVDLATTILDWADAQPSGARPSDGLSLLDTAALAERDTVLIQAGDGERDSDHGWRYRGVLTDRYLYATHPGDPSVGLLFDREVDPWALDNVYGDPRYAAVQAELHRRLAVLRDCSGAECNQHFGDVPAPVEQVQAREQARERVRPRGEARSWRE